MRYWLYITNRENWSITKHTNILGASERNQNVLSKVEVGDKCLVYVKGEVTAGQRSDPKIVALYEVASSVFSNNTEIFVAPSNRRSETYPVRLLLKPITEFKPPVEFKPLIRKLSFVPNTKYWTWPMRGRAMVQIPQTDHDCITSRASYLANKSPTSQ
jgi:predicted RNA-binding protein